MVPKKLTKTVLLQHCLEASSILCSFTNEVSLTFRKKKIPLNPSVVSLSVIILKKILSQTSSFVLLGHSSSVFFFHSTLAVFISLLQQSFC